MSPPLGLLADVVPFSWVDGPGNRFAVFLQGCNLDCLACQTEEAVLGVARDLYGANLCCIAGACDTVRTRF